MQLLSVASLAHAASAAASPEITWLPDNAKAVSADGSAAVGVAFGPGGHQGWRWTQETGMEFLGDFSGSVVSSSAYSVSGDGSVVVGWGTPADGRRLAFRWENGVMEPLKGTLPQGARASEAWAVSDDGRTVGGNLELGGAFVWTADNGFTLLPRSGEGFQVGELRGLSADGAAATGGGGIGDGINRGYHWTAETGLTDLGLLPAEKPFTLPWAISADGSSVVGVAGSGPEPTAMEAFRWKDGQIMGLGDLSGRGWTEAFDVSGDGSIVVGTDVADLRAFIWIEGRGMLDLKEYLIGDHGMDLTGWTLRGASGITPDGRTIVGSAIDPLGRGGGFIVTIPAPASAGVLALAGVVAWRRRR